MLHLHTDRSVFKVMIDTKQHIIDRSYELFLAHSYEAVSISDISKAIGMTKGALYHHFSSKDELFRAIIDKYLKIPEPECNLEEITLKEFIKINVAEMRSSIEEYMSYSSEFNPINYIALFIDAFRHYPGFMEQKNRIIKQETYKTEVVLKNAIERKEIRSDINIPVTAYTITSVFMGFAGNLVFDGCDTDSAFKILTAQLQEYYKVLKI